jgi:hypothetical protein
MLADRDFTTYPEQTIGINCHGWKYFHNIKLNCKKFVAIILNIKSKIQNRTWFIGAQSHNTMGGRYTYNKIILKDLSAI